MTKLSDADRVQWRNIWCILRSLDLHELKRVPNFDWDNFRDKPHRYLISTDDRQAAAIWDAVEKRMK